MGAEFRRMMLVRCRNRYQKFSTDYSQLPPSCVVGPTLRDRMKYGDPQRDFRLSFTVQARVGGDQISYRWVYGDP